MTHSDRVHPAGAHLYVIISPDADDAESSVDAAVVEVLDELGVAASRSGGSIGRGGDVAVVDVLLNVGNVVLLLHGGISLVVDAARIVRRVARRLRGRGQFIAYSHDSLLLLCVADLLVRHPGLEVDRVYLDYDSGAPEHDQAFIVDDRDEFLFVFSDGASRWVYAVTGSGSLELLYELGDWTAYKFEHRIDDPSSTASDNDEE